jgi:hypothetical protein
MFHPFLFLQFFRKKVFVKNLPLDLLSYFMFCPDTQFLKFVYVENKDVLSARHGSRQSFTSNNTHAIGFHQAFAITLVCFKSLYLFLR